MPSSDENNRQFTLCWSILLLLTTSCSWTCLSLPSSLKHKLIRQLQWVAYWQKKCPSQCWLSTQASVLPTPSARTLSNLPSLHWLQPQALSFPASHVWQKMAAQSPGQHTQINSELLCQPTFSPGEMIQALWHGKLNTIPRSSLTHKQEG